MSEHNKDNSFKLTKTIFVYLNLFKFLFLTVQLIINYLISLSKIHWQNKCRYKIQVVAKDNRLLTIYLFIYYHHTEKNLHLQNLYKYNSINIFLYV